MLVRRAELRQQVLSGSHMQGGAGDRQEFTRVFMQVVLKSSMGGHKKPRGQEVES